MQKFWNWAKGADGKGILRIEQEIVQEPNWWDGSGDTPKAFREELEAQGGRDIDLWINSPGGDVFAGASIYTMLKAYEGHVTVKVDGLAASAASVISMAGDVILMSPPSNMMIHRAWTWLMGNCNDLERAKAQLAEVDEAMIATYMLKTKKPREEIVSLMDAETFMSPAKAMELGFADGVLFMDRTDGEIAPAACVLTPKGIYAYAGRRMDEKPDPEREVRARIVEEAKRALGMINK